MSTAATDSRHSPPDPLHGQLRLYKILAATLAVILLLGTAFALYARHQGQPVVIEVDGKPVTTVRNAAAANQILTAAMLAKVGSAYAGDDPVRLQSIRLRHMPGDSLIDPDSIALTKLSALLQVNVHGYVILVNGKRSIALPTEQAALDTLNLVKDHWAQMPPVADLATEPVIIDQVKIERLAVSADRTRGTAAEAAPYFWTPPSSKTYRIHRGDTGGRVAHRNHLSLAEFITANPNQDMNRLKAGEWVNVQKMPLLLTVRVQKKMVRNEKILAGTPDAYAGLRAVTYVVTYTNGQETQRDVEDIAILQKPFTRTDIE